MCNAASKLFFLFLFLSTIIFGQIKSENYLLSNHQIHFSESSLENQKSLDELILSLNSNDEKLITVLVISENFINQSSYKDALKYVFQAETLSKTSNSENLKAYTQILLASFYRGLELNNKSIENLEKAINPLSLIKDPAEKNFVEAKYLLEKGTLNFSMNKENEALKSLWKSKLKFERIENENVTVNYLQLINSRIGNFYLSKNELDSSKFYFNQNLKLSKKISSLLSLELRAKNGISKYYLNKKQIDSALYYISDFSEIVKKEKDLRLKNTVYKNISQIYYAANDVTNYKHFNQKYLKLNDLIYQSDKETRLLLAKQADGVEVIDTSEYKTLWIYLALGLASIGLILTYAYHLKLKREYAQFQEIMRRINEQENLDLRIFTELNSTNTYAISEKTEQIILDKLKKFEHSEKYINSKISLQFLAKQLDTNTKYLSEIINKSKGQNFNNYINELRIHYILRKLKSEPKYQNYKVSSLAEECGFNSRNTFTLAFKNTLGISPAKFISFIKKENFKDES